MTFRIEMIPPEIDATCYQALIWAIEERAIKDALTTDRMGRPGMDREEALDWMEWAGGRLGQVAYGIRDGKITMKNVRRIYRAKPNEVKWSKEDQKDLEEYEKGERE